MINPTSPIDWLWGWLKQNQTPKTIYHHFTYYQYIEDADYRPQIQTRLAQLLHQYHRHYHVDFTLLRHLGFPLLAQELAGDERPYLWETRVGNFIEILCCEFAKKLGYGFPVVRLQFNSNPNQSMKGDDVLGFQLAQSSDQENIVLIGESKFRSQFSTKVVSEAYEALKKGFRPYPNSLNFVVTILRHQDKPEVADKIEQLGRQLSQAGKRVQKHYLVGLGTASNPDNPFGTLEELNDGGELLPNLIAVNFVFQSGFKTWLNDVYQHKGFDTDGHSTE